MAAWTRPVLAPTPVSMRRLALAGVIANTVIMSTGAAVRLSASGLGCPDWPQCSTADVVASKNAGQTLLNTWIEFGNRLLNFPLVIIAALIAGGGAMFRPAVLATGAVIGILSSVIPYRLELESLRRIPMRLFGVWMSLEPAVGALIGLLLLGQHLSVTEWLAICCVMVACAGAAQH